MAAEHRTVYVVIPESERPTEDPVTITVEIYEGKTYYIPPWADGFIEALRTCASIRQACQKVGISRTTAYSHRKYSPAFSQRWDDAVQDSYDLIYETAVDRAVNGKGRPVFYMGQQVGEITEYSDMLLGMLMKGTNPKMFKDRVDVTSGDEPLAKPTVYLPQIEDGNTVSGDIPESGHSRYRADNSADRSANDSKPTFSMTKNPFESDVTIEHNKEPNDVNRDGPDPDII